MMKALRTLFDKRNEKNPSPNLLKNGRCIVFIFAYISPIFYIDLAAADLIDLECTVIQNNIHANGSVSYNNYEVTHYIELDLNEKNLNDSKVRLTNFSGIVFQNKITHHLCDKNHPCSISFKADERRIISTLILEYPDIRSQQTWNLNLDRVSGRVTYGFRNWNANGPADGNGFSGQCRKKMREF